MDRRDVVVEQIIKGRQINPGPFQINLSDLQIKLPGPPEYNSTLSQAGVVWTHNEYQTVCAAYYGISLQKEEYMTIMKYADFIRGLPDRVQYHAELDEIFKPQQPVNWGGSFESGFGNTQTEFNLGDYTICVTFDELTENQVEVGFDIDGISTGRHNRGLNTVMLFQNIIWLIAEFYRHNQTITRFKIVAPDGEDNKTRLYRQISTRKEVVDFLKGSGLVTRIDGSTVYVEKQ